MMRNCWALGLVGVCALAWAAGCSHPCYMTEGDLHQCMNGPLPSEHAVPSGLAGFEQAPVSGSQTPAS